MSSALEPSPLLVRFSDLFRDELPGPVLDLACGECHNGLYVARKGLELICCDRAAERLNEARKVAGEYGVNATVWELDLEAPGVNPLPEDRFGAILVFRYLHRPLIPGIRQALRRGGLLLYETYTVEQARYGKPHNPDFLLQAGELLRWFEGWELIHYFEGTREDPRCAVAQIVCRKPKQ